MNTQTTQTNEYHNPDNVKPEQVGKGWRFCLKSEIENPPKDTEFWDGAEWAERAYSGHPLIKSYSYRTRAPLPQVQPQPEENFHCQPDKHDPYAELKAAHAAGKTIQNISVDGTIWHDVPDPRWCGGPEAYRIKPEEQEPPVVTVAKDLADTLNIPEGCLPFDLEKAKAGAPLITRDGREAKFIAHVPEALESERVIVMIDSLIRCFRESGVYLPVVSSNDLFLRAPRKVKREGWVAEIFDSESEARRYWPNYIITRVEWEDDEK